MEEELIKEKKCRSLYIALGIMEDIGIARMKMCLKTGQSLINILFLYFLCRNSTTRFSGIFLDQAGG